MATRIEKKFKRNAIRIMHQMLTDAESLRNNKALFRIFKDECELSKKVIKIIKKFYIENEISNKEIEDAINAK